MFASPIELGVIVFLIILFFGYKRLPKTGRNLGQAVAELRHADDRAEEEPES